MIKDIIQNNEALTPNSQTLEVLQAHFPQCFNKEGFFDVDKFKDLIKADVDITHENISNLRVDLISPSGKRAVLHNRTGIGKKNLQNRYDSQSKASIAALLGQSLKGRWALMIRDLAGREVGKLNGWSIEATY